MTQTVKKNYSPNKCKLVQLLWKKSMTVPQKLKRKLPFSSVAQSYPTLCDPMDCSTPGFPVLQHLLELAQTVSTESVMPSKHLILCCSFLLLPSIFLSIRIFFKELSLSTRWPKYLGFSFIISLSDEYSGLISFRIDWFDLLTVQGPLKSLLQGHKI